MALADDLATIRDNIVARLKDISENPKPSYVIDGQEIRWQEYFTSLMNALDKINEQIDRNDGPFEERTKVYT